MGTITPIRFLNILLVATVVLLLILTFGLEVNPGVNLIDNSALNGTIRYEFIKSLLQLLVVGIIGGFIKVVLDGEQNKRNESRIKAEMGADFFKRLGNVYRNVKLIRRELRAGGLTDKYNNVPGQLSTLQSSLYIEQMKEINKAQLELEALKIEVKYLPAFINHTDIQSWLTTMEKYLGSIIKEYETIGSLLYKNTPVEALTLARLFEFTGEIKGGATFKQDPQKSYHFEDDFSSIYAAIIRTLSKSLEPEKNSNQ